MRREEEGDSEGNEDKRCTVLRGQVGGRGVRASTW